MVIILVILTSLFAVPLLGDPADSSNASAKVEYSSPSEPHITKTIVIRGRSVAVRPLFGRPIYTKPLRTGTGKAFAFASVRSRAPPRRVNYEEQTPQYMNHVSMCSRASDGTYTGGSSCEPPRRQQYPLPQCYTNKSGFMCCNRMLETEMRKTFNQLKASQHGAFKTCNIQKIANALQQNLQQCFNSSFETIAAIDDFASMIHFFGDQVCKLEIDGRYLLAYGTPRQLPPSPPFVVHQQSPFTYGRNITQSQQYTRSSMGLYRWGAK